jgi:hypothetical protein
MPGLELLQYQNPESTRSQMIGGGAPHPSRADDDHIKGAGHQWDTRDRKVT